jgi:pyrimidine operon attenuation protein/uracil phosphoribosyltransferase
MKTKVLSERQINQKLDRIAYEVLEETFGDKEVHLIGIQGNGEKLVEMLYDRLEKITSQKLIRLTIAINKKLPLKDPITLSDKPSSLENGVIILIDDVINSGKTMQYALLELLKNPTKKIKTVALVDRKHRRFPIRCDFVGLTLSTTLQDRVEVEFSKEIQAFLV